MLENALPLPVKAAGGVRTYDEALEMIRLGVKIGTSGARQLPKGTRIQGTKLSMKINMAKVFFYHFSFFTYSQGKAIIYLRSDFLFFLSAKFRVHALENCFYNEVQEFVLKLCSARNLVK
jgi:hypothetical protein